jgi:hypothetical protein
MLLHTFVSRVHDEAARGPEAERRVAIMERAGGSAVKRLPPWRDIRECIERVRVTGELREIAGVDWQSEIGEVTELLDHNEGSPCVLFDEVPRYPAGRRMIVNCPGTTTRQAVTLNLPPSEGNHNGLFRFWRTVLRELSPI